MKDLKKFINEKLDILDDGSSAKIVFKQDNTLKIVELSDAINTIIQTLKEQNEGDYNDLIVKGIANSKPSYFKFDNNNEGVFEFKSMGTSQYINKDGVTNLLNELMNEKKKSNDTIQVHLDGGLEGKLICDIRSNKSKDMLEISFYKQSENYKLGEY